MVSARCRLWLTFLSLFFSVFAAAQLPLIHQQATRFSAGYILSAPVVLEYFDHSVTRGTDYFWEYSVEPRLGNGWFLGISRLVSKDLEKGNGFIEYGLEYRRPSSVARYSGWEGGGSSNIFYYGEGMKSWTDHYLAFDIKMTHHFFVGAKQHDILNSLAFSLENRICQVRRVTFDGIESTAWGNTPFASSDRDYSWIITDPEIPQMRLYYEFGWVVRTKAGAFIPLFKTSLLNFSNFIPQRIPVYIPLDRKREYAKELLFGISWIPGAVQD